MNWSIFVVASIVVLCLTLIFVIVSSNITKRKLKISLYNIFFIGIIVSLFILLLPLEYNNENLGVLGKIFYTAAHTVMVVTGGVSVEILENAIGLQTWQYAYAALLAVIAFVMTIGFILQFFTGFFAKIQCSVNRYKKLFLFSELNEKSIILAKSIRESVSDNIFFAFADSPGKNTDEDYINEAKNMGALLLKEDIICFPYKKRKAETTVIFCKEKEIDNINDVVVLLDEDHDSGELFSYYVFSSEDEYENIVSSCVKEKIDKNNPGNAIPRVILIDSIHTEIYRLFMNHPLYLGTRQNETIQLMVIGSGQVAKEAVQIASWFGQMMTRELSILMLCSDVDGMKREFYQNYPEIQLNCPIVYEEERSFDYINHAKGEGKKTNYIIVAQENDLCSLKTAVQLRTIFSSTGLINGYNSPEICVWNEEGKLHNELKHLTNEFGGECQITPFGGNEIRYSYQNIFNSEIDQEGLIIHQFYGGSKDDYYYSEYNRKSSCALALHIRYTIYELQELYNNGKPLRVSDYERILAAHEIDLLRAEHIRWSAFMRARGYQKLPLSVFESLLNKKIEYINDNKSKAFIEKNCIDSHVIESAKLHACLADWDAGIENPLSYKNCHFDNTSKDQILSMKKQTDAFDDLDRVTLTCWEYLKKDEERNQDHKINIFKGGEKQKKNFKDNDKDVLEIIPLMISQMKMIYIRRAAGNGQDVFIIKNKNSIPPFLKDSIKVKQDSFILDGHEGEVICKKEDIIAFEKNNQYKSGWHCWVVGHEDTKFNEIVDENWIKSLIVRAERVTQDEPSLFDVSENYELINGTEWINKSQEEIRVKIDEGFWLFCGLEDDTPKTEMLQVCDEKFRDYFVCDRKGMIINTLENYYNS